MEIRELTEDDLEAQIYLSSQAFALGNRDMPHATNPNRPTSHRYGVWTENGLQAKVVILNFTVQFGPEVQMPMGGVAGVVSLPGSRGKGYARDCLLHSMSAMRERGQVVSTLFPFSFKWYQQMGWDWTGIHLGRTVATRDLPRFPEVDLVREAVPEDRAAIAECYLEFARRYRGMVVRTDKGWNQVLDHTKDKHTFTYLVEQRGMVTGYLVMQGWERNTTKLREFIANTPEAYRGLLSLLRRHDMQIKNFSWPVPGDDPLWMHTVEWRFKTKHEPSTQARIIDLKPALENWRCDPSFQGNLVLGIRDEQSDWNDGAWKIIVERGRLLVVRTKDPPQVELHIRQMSQAFFGTPDLRAIRFSGGVAVHDEGAIQLLSAVLDGPPMWMNDSF